MKQFVVLLSLAAALGAPPGDLLLYERSVDAMGSTYSIAVYGRDRGRLQTAVDQALEEARRLDGLLSNYRPESEWSQINRFAAQQPVKIGPELFQLLVACLDFSRRSEGTFDISVGPLMKIWGFYKGSGHLPHRAEVRAALDRVGYQKILLDPAQQTVRFQQAGMEIDPGGIGKGYAVDRMAEVLRAGGITSGLITAGSSSIYAIGTPPGEQGWKVSIRDPHEEGKSVAAVYLKNQSLSTSGSYEKFFRAEGRVYAHIMDPRTGFPAPGMLSVSIVSPRTLDSEAWCKPVLHSGPPLGGGPQTVRISRLHVRRQIGSTMRVAPMNSRFLDACRRRPTDVRPVWFMRQAGRYMKQYREIRARHSILEICKKPELAAAVTLQPIEVLNVDAAIIFADLLLPVEPMGLKLEFIKDEGPRIDNPVRTSSDIDTLSTSNTDDLGYVGESIQQVVRALAGKVPVIGFVGAPFTLASYMIEGGPSKTFVRTKEMMYRDETLWRRLMGKLVDVLGPFAIMQVNQGARAIQVFDSWVGALGPDDYVRYVAPYSRALIERIRSTGVPTIHFGTGAAGFFRELHAAGGDVMGVDWRVNIDQAWMDISYRSAVQGNLDPAVLFAPLPEIKTRVHELLRRTGTRPGHIFNLGHGILPETPVDHVKAVVEMVREFRP